MATKSSTTKKAAPKKTASSKKPTARKTASTQKTAAPKQSAEEKVAADVLKLVDQAAHLLRTGVRSGAEKAAKNRAAAAKQAHSLLHKATGVLTKNIEGAESILQKGIKKIAP